jgi:GNAT superfamily N-acetyltransferase
LTDAGRIVGMSNPSITIRAIRDDDDLDELHDGNYEWSGATLARRLTASSAEAMLAFHVAVADNRLVGYLDGFLPPDDNPTHQGFATIWVPPKLRGQGVGSALWDAAMLTARDRGAKRLTSHADSKDEASLRWLRARGATTGGLHLESTLELSDVLPLTAPPPGVTIETLDTTSSEEAWRAAFSAHNRLMLDTPDAETNPTPIPYEIYRTLLAEPWQVCVARNEDGEYVGLTTVFVKNEREHIVNTMITAVNREWRNKGLATALKTAHAIKLRDAGWRAIITQNMEGNDHILAANKRLGFKPSNAMLDVIYDLPQES